MSKNIDDKLKLIYIHKIGYTSDGYGVYEFIFSDDPSNIDVDQLGWEDSPAADYAKPPEKYQKIINLKTNKFNLFCLHEAYDRPYVHGYYNIHALAYENVFDDDTQSDGFKSYDNVFNNAVDDNDDSLILVFHFEMTLETIKELLYNKGIILKDNEFIETSTIDL